MKAESSTHSRNSTLLIAFAVALGTLIVAAFVAMRVFFPAFTVGSDSMLPTLGRGDGVFVERSNRLPYRGELVAFRFPPDHTQIYLHRIVGLPGDHLQMRAKKLYRNGELLAEAYTQHASPFADSYRDNFPAAPNFPPRRQVIDMLENNVTNGALVVPPGHYFVMGDNRDDAADSRYFGFIERSDIIGRPFLVYHSSAPERNWKGLR